MKNNYQFEISHINLSMLCYLFQMKIIGLKEEAKINFYMTQLGSSLVVRLEVV